MKRNSTGIFLGFTLTLLLSFSQSNQDVKNSTAEVNRISGLYVFTDSYPVKQYEVLGTVKNTVSLSGGQYEPVRNKLIRKVKDDYPAADGIIIYPNNGGTDKAEAIKFK